jgi:hypothetical protein
MFYNGLESKIMGTKQKLMQTGPILILREEYIHSLNGNFDFKLHFIVSNERLYFCRHKIKIQI